MSEKKNPGRHPRNERWGLHDMYGDRPDGIAGQVMLGVWGCSEHEFGEIVMKEHEDKQRRNPDKFVKKVAPKGLPKK